MERSQPFLLRCTHGRLALELRLLPAGQDWQLLLTGGDAHIGAVILAEPANAMPPDVPKAMSARTAGGRSRPGVMSDTASSGTEDGVRLHVLRRAGHHDDKAALPLARDYCRALKATVCVSAGIHYDHISREEIDTVLALARMLGVSGGYRRTTMLTVKDLEEFENYMRSGELETDFKDGCENDRYYLLELLEKFMDVAELADETATKVIFRGQIGLLAGAGAAPEGEKK